MRALVTGANGFIGGAVCEELSRRGVFVRAAVRRTGDRLPVDDVFATGDIGPQTDWSGAVADVDVIFHIAGLAHLPSLSAEDCETLRLTNIEGVRSLADAARRAHIRRFVFLSTAKVHGETSGTRSFRETDPPAPPDAYAAAKLEAEGIVGGMIGERSVIVRAPLVYGAGVKANFLSLMRAVDARLPLPLGAVRNERTLIFVRNLAHAMVELGQRDDTAGVFLAGDSAPVSTPELIRALGRALDRKPRLIPVPVSLLRAAASVVGARQKFEKTIGSLALDTGKLAATGWRPPYTMEQGLAETAAWFRSTRR